MLGTVLIVVLILMLVGALPRWGHSRNWGYYPSGGIGLVLLILLILLPWAGSKGQAPAVPARTLTVRTQAIFNRA